MELKFIYLIIKILYISQILILQVYEMFTILYVYNSSSEPLKNLNKFHQIYDQCYHPIEHIFSLFSHKLM